MNRSLWLGFCAFGAGMDARGAIHHVVQGNAGVAVFLTVCGALMLFLAYVHSKHLRTVP